MILWFRRSSNHPKLAEIEAKRICLIKPSALGDVVQTLPVLTALRSRFPNAHIAWVVNRAYADILAGHPHLNETIVFDRGRGKPWSRSARAAFFSLLRMLQERQFDLACDLQGLLRSSIMARATRAARRIGLGDAREGARLFYTDVVPVPRCGMSAVDRYWLLAGSLGVGPATKQFVIPVSPSERLWAGRQWDGAGGLCVAIHPGARWMTKRWPTGHYAEIARRLEREATARIVLVGGTEETDAARQIESAVRGRCVNLTGQTSLKQLAAVLCRVDLLLTNDSGPMHLAAALGTPVAGIFTCTSPDRARPYGSGHLIIGTSVWCAASYLKKCSRMECMSELTPDRVWPLLRDHLAALRVPAVASAS